MGRKKWMAGLLALALLATLVPAALAGSFSDVPQDHWAVGDIESMAEKGILKGYGGGLYKPDNQVTALETLAICSRLLQVGGAVKSDIADAWESTVKTILKGEDTWAYGELALALEAGIVTQGELKAFVQAGTLKSPAKRQDVALWLVRAMQASPQAERLQSATLSFDDFKDISKDRVGYVAYLTQNGIVLGANNKFLPLNGVKRSEVAAFAARTLKFMDQKGIEVQLPNYTDFDFKAGTVNSVAGGTALTVVLDTAQGVESLLVPASAKVFVDNQRAGTADVKSGMYGVVQYDDGSVVNEARFYSATEQISGDVIAVSQQEITVKTGAGGTVTLALDRLTRVTLGTGKTGGPGLIDPAGKYATAVVLTDTAGRAFALRLLGPSETYTGVVQSVDLAADTVAVTTLDGYTRLWEVPDTAQVTVNGASSTLSSALKGSFVTCKVSADTGMVQSLSADTKTSCLQGTFKSYSMGLSNITVYDPITAKSTTYYYAKDAAFRYSGKEAELTQVEKNAFLTAKLDGNNRITEADFYPATRTISGTISSITYGTVIYVDVEQKDGTDLRVGFRVSSLPTVKRGDAVSSVDKLIVGDRVTVSISSNEVTLIQAEAQTANATGTIVRIVQDASGSSLTILPEGGSSEVTYPLATNVSITMDGVAIPLSSLKAGYTVGLVVVNDQITAITAKKSEVQTTELSGIVLFVNTKDYTLLVQTPEGNLTVVVDRSKTAIMNLSGTRLSLANLAPEDPVTVIGSYDGALFNATTILAKK